MASPGFTSLQPLRYLIAVARVGSISAAARALRVSQPSVSNAIKALEVELSTTLLSRRRDGVALTATGQELIHYAAEALRLLSLAEARVLGLEEDDIGRFTIGSPEAIGAYFLARVLPGVLARMPRVELVLRSGPSRDMERAVVERDLELAIVVNPLPHPDLVLTRLFEDRTELVARGASRTRRAAVARLGESTLYYVDALPQSQAILRALDRAGQLPARRVPVGGFAVAAAFAESEGTVAVLPRRVAAQASAHLTPVHESLPHVADTITLAYRADLHRTRAAVRLRDAIVAEGRAFAQR